MNPALILKLGPYILIAVLLMAVFASESGRKGALAERDVWKERSETRARIIKDFEKVSETLTAQRDSAITRINELADKAAIAAIEGKKTTDALERAKSERNKLQAQLELNRRTANATDKQCSTWSVHPVCGPVSDSLRDQWEATRRATGASGGNRNDPVGVRGDTATPDDSNTATGSASASRYGEPGLFDWMLHTRPVAGYAINCAVGTS